MWITKFGKHQIRLYIYNMTIQKINLTMLGIIYENGNTEIAVVTPRQWAQRMRNKKFKKTIIKKSELASIHIKIKTK